MLVSWFLQLPDVVLIKDEDSDSNDNFEEGGCFNTGAFEESLSLIRPACETLAKLAEELVWSGGLLYADELIIPLP